MILNLILISIICVIIIDISGFPDEIQRLIWKWVWKNEQVKPEYKPFIIKPIFCSLCMSWWSGFIYLLVTSQLSIYSTALTLVIASFTPQIADFIRLVQDAVTTITEGIRKIFKIE